MYSFGACVAYGTWAVELVPYVEKPREYFADLVNVEVESVDIAFHVEKMVLIQTSYENYLLDRRFLDCILRRG